MPTFLAILAVIGFMVPPVQIVHAHDEGHDPHVHGIARTLHAPLSGHAHPHSHSAVRLDRDDDSSGDPDDDAGDHPHDGNAPEHHVHNASAHDAIARVRGSGPVLDGATGTMLTLAPVVGIESILSAPQSADIVQRGRDAPRAHLRTLDRLILIGRLLI